FNADFKGFAALLNALERNRPVIFIDKFLIEKSKQRNLEPKVTMNLTVLVRKHQDG
ncbi:MAG: GspMb/PilO family protein, partial [Planctomycetota bacterium]